jgi:putative sigma-54 modulation protein
VTLQPDDQFPARAQARDPADRESAAGSGRVPSHHRRVALHAAAAQEPGTAAFLFPKPWKGGSMNLTISGHHLEVTPALREYVVSKLDRVTRHFDQVVDINVLLTVEKQKEKERRQRAEVTLHVKGRDIFCEQSNEDLYAAIDQLMDKLDRQVCRHKEMVQNHGHASAKRLDLGASA